MPVHACTLTRPFPRAHTFVHSHARTSTGLYARPSTRSLAHVPPRFTASCETIKTGPSQKMNIYSSNSKVIIFFPSVWTLICLPPCLLWNSIFVYVSMSTSWFGMKPISFWKFTPFLPEVYPLTLWAAQFWAFLSSLFFWKNTIKWRRWDVNGTLHSWHLRRCYATRPGPTEGQPIHVLLEHQKFLKLIFRHSV